MNTELHVRQLEHRDYDKHLVKWWKAWKWEAPTREALPEQGVNGFIVYDNEQPVCAGFLYETNSAIAWVEWIISNPKYRKKPHRSIAIKLLIETLTNYAHELGYSVCYTILQHKGLAEAYKSAGYIVTTSNNTELIKRF